MTFWNVFWIIVGVIGAYVLSTICRASFQEMRYLRGFGYAHRGLHSPGVPENSMAAFRAARDGGFGIELDVHLMKDGNLAVIHDHSLLRTAGVDVKIEDLTAQELENYRLEGTDEKIPLFEQVIELFAGRKEPLIVELKVDGKNYGALAETVCDMLENKNVHYCLESFDPRCVKWLKNHRGEVLRGQLAENYFKSKNCKLNFFLKFLLTHQMMNIVTQPDFVAYKFEDRNTLENLLVRKVWLAQCVTWTVRNREDYQKALKQDCIVIFEGFVP